jgi:ubiquitin conjugation factor E4 B
MCSTYMMLANETVHMFQYMTTEIVQPFLRPEVINRLVGMLNYNIVQLVGSKCSNLKVRYYDGGEDIQFLRFILLFS